MTSINVVLKRDRALMMTDAAMYLPTGEIVAFGQKAVAMPTLKAAVACRGGQLQTAVIALELPAQAKNFDDLSHDPEHLARLLRTILRDYDHIFTWSHIQVCIVGWSDTERRARGFIYDSVEDTIEEVDDYAFSPLPDEDEFANLHTIGCEIDTDVPVAAFRADKHGIPLMEAQRRMRTTVSGMDGEHHIVGGNILVTEIDATGITQRVIHEWPDEIGQPLQPAPFVATVPGGMSRSERRRLDKASRKSLAA